MATKVENKRNSKKPTLKKFKAAAEQCGGNMTKIAKSFGVLRVTVKDWTRKDPDFKEVIDEYKQRLFDECMNSARILALGIPEVKDGKVVGWKERPDAGMLRYYLSRLGKDEGFGDSLDITSNGKDVGTGITVEIIDRREQVKAPQDEQL